MLASGKEAERRYPDFADWPQAGNRRIFVAGWNECESRYRELLEAAEAYREAKDAHSRSMTPFTRMRWVESKARLLAAAATLPKEE